jgi:hypothetical protein
VTAVVGTAVATALTLGAGAFAAIEKLESDSGCLSDRSFCRDSTAQSQHDTARTFAWISTGALIAAAVGTVVLIVAPPRRRDSRPTSVTAKGGWYGLGGSF